MAAKQFKATTSITTDLENAAATKFHAGQNPIVLKPNSASDADEEEIAIQHNICQPFLQCFGSKISNIRIRYEELANEDDSCIDLYVNQCHFNSLDVTVFNVEREFSNEIFQELLKKAAEVCISNNQLNKSRLDNFAKWFPYMRSLTIERVTLNGRVIDTQFSVDFHWILWFIISQCRTNIARKCPGEECEIGFNLPSNVNKAELLKFPSEHSNVIELTFPCYQFAPNDIIDFLDQLKSLKKFHFEANDQFNYDRLLKQLDTDWQHDIEMCLNSIRLFR